MKKACVFVVCIVMSIALLAGCGSKLPKGFDKEEVTARATEIVGYFNALDFEAVEGTVRADLLDILSAEDLEAALKEHIVDMGTFKEISSTAVGGDVEPGTDEDYAIVVVIADYENGKARWTVSLDKNLELIGIYMNK